MREILFRGKRKDTGEWVIGSLVRHAPDEYHIVNIIVCRGGDEIEDSFPVIIDTIGQFTGLTDKNGKYVFEGDILAQLDRHDKTSLIRAVQYEMSCGSCCTQVFGFGASGELHLDFIRLDEPFEIVGNIHDNPELLEVK